MSNSRSSQILKRKAEGGCLCLCNLKLIPPKEKECPDHLKNWELWMRRRKQIHSILGEKLGCHPTDLVMNSADTYRIIKEEKLVLEYSKIVTNFDKYRGNPNFWRLPWSLKNRKPPYKGTEYFITEFKEERNIIPEIEYVGVPDIILKEKDILPRTRHLKNMWQESSYRKQIVERFSEKLLEIEPHKPDFSDFIIIGANFTQQSEESTTPEIQESVVRKEFEIGNIVTQEFETEVEVIPDEESEISLSPLPKLSVKINGKEFHEYSDFTYKENKMYIMFEYFVGSILPGKQSIRFENTGLTTLRLYWKPYKKLMIFREFSEKTNIYHPFKFNKNELLLLPGMEKKLVIWFQTEKPGNYIERWEITSLPKIWRTDFHFIFLLKGFAFIKNYEDRVFEISERLSKRMRNTAIKDLLNDLICRGIYNAPGITHSSNFSEEQLFESANLITNIVVQTPKYIYSSSVISELKLFYKKVRSSDDPPEWDLSIKKLGELARKKDMLVYFENQLELYNIVKLKRNASKENEYRNSTGSKQERENSKKQADKVSKAVVQEPEEITTVPTYHDSLIKILKKLERPSMYVNKERKKYLFSYIVIKTYFWKIFGQLDNLDGDPESRNQKQRSNTYPMIKRNYLLPVPDRLLYETFDESYILRTRRTPHISGLSIAKPKALLLKGISCSDVRKIHKIYFSKDDTGQKAIQLKTRVNEVKKPGSPKQQRSQISQDEDLLLYVDEEFDPFSGEEFDPFSGEPYDPLTPEITTNDSPIKNTAPLGKINEKTYLLVYTTLCEAVEALVDTIEACDERNISSDILRELQKCDISASNVNYVEEEKTLQSSVSERMSNTSYFEYLQELHWTNNLNTKKYFVNNQTLSPDIKNLRSKEQTKLDIKKKDEISNIFSPEDFIRKIEPYCLKEKEAQTDGYQDESVPQGKVPSRKVSAESLGESKNIFYFLNFGLEKESNSVPSPTTG